MISSFLIFVLFTIPFGEAPREVFSLDIAMYQAQPDTQMVKDLIDDLNLSIERGDFADARNKISTISKWSEEIKYPYGKGAASLHLAEVYLNEQFYDSAEVLLLELTKDEIDPRLQLPAFNLLATSYRYQNKTEQAIGTYKKVLEIAKEEDDKKMTARIQQNLAVAYADVGDKAASLENHLLSLNYAEEAKDTTLWITILNNLGNELNTFGELDKAEFYLEKSIQLATLKGKKADVLRSVTNLANVKSGQNKLDDALELYLQGLELAKEVRPNTPPVIITFNLGYLYLKMDNYVDAERLLKESLKYCIEMGILEGQYYNYDGLGKLEELKGNSSASTAYYFKAYEIAKKINSTPFLEENLPKLYESFKKSENFERAVFYLEEFKTLSDSLYDLDREREFVKLENEIELKRQAEINELLNEKQAEQERKLQFQTSLIIAGLVVILLILYILYVLQKAGKEKTKANAQLREQQKELERLNLEMKKVFAIVAHDLRSPLTSMQGILFLMKSGDLSKTEKDDFLEKLETSVQRNIDVMEDLLSWAKEQMQGITFAKEKVHLFEAVNSVILKQEESAEKKGVILKNEVSKDVEILADKNGLDLILRNLLSNSIKFTNADDEIRFTCTENENSVQLCVIDTGVGMSEEVIDKVFSNTSISFSKRGTMGEVGTGFGLSLVKEFVKKLDGTLSVKSEEGKGSTFCIEFPK